MWGRFSLAQNTTRRIDPGTRSDSQAVVTATTIRWFQFSRPLLAGSSTEERGR